MYNIHLRQHLISIFSYYWPFLRQELLLIKQTTAIYSWNGDFSPIALSKQFQNLFLPPQLKNQLFIAFLHRNLWKNWENVQNSNFLPHRGKFLPYPPTTNDTKNMHLWSRPNFAKLTNYYLLTIKYSIHLATSCCDLGNYGIVLAIFSANLALERSVIYRDKYFVLGLGLFPITSCFTSRILPNFNVCKIPVKPCQHLKFGFLPKNLKKLRESFLSISDWHYTKHLPLGPN